ncbi:MAG: PEP-CTERM sorting domain-containing protein [Pirellulales bacterium]|nr:PEP-CTERM sorting domain-containing protein [Pirellulales bacterium]
MTRTLICIGLVFAVLLGFGPAFVHAGIVNLASNNSTVQIDTSTQVGVHQWTVDGIDYLAKQWFWYRIGDTGPEYSFDSLAPVGSGVQIIDPTEAVLYYTNGSGMNVDVDIRLTGMAPGSGQADLTEQLKFTNTSASAMNLRFFQYCDFDLSNGLDTVQFLTPNYVIQQSGGGVNVVESLVNNHPQYHQAALVPVLLNNLNDGGTTTLNNANGPFIGDASWAFQWNFTVQPNGGTFTITKIKVLTVVPEPASIALLCLGGIAGCGLYWIRKRGR